MGSREITQVGLSRDNRGGSEQHVRGVLQLVVGLQVGHCLALVEKDVLALHCSKLEGACAQRTEQRARR